jgi:hypothetical protein
MNGFTTFSLPVLWNDDVAKSERLSAARPVRGFRLAAARQAAENIDPGVMAMGESI